MMDCYKYFVSLLLLCGINKSAVSDSEIQCSLSKNCFCASSVFEVEFQCPNENETKFVVKIDREYEAVSIQCLETLNLLEDDFPQVAIEKANYFTILHCSLVTNFGQIMRRLGINSTMELRLDFSPNFANASLVVDFFEGLSRLKRLVLNHDNIKEIDENAFDLLDELVELDLQHNKIQLTESLFKNLPNLQMLNLADNKLTHLPSQVFQNLPKLKSLYLQSNRIMTLNSSVFINLKNLNLLELSRNPLEYLPENLFHGLENLKKLAVSATLLKNVPENLLKFNPLLEAVNMNKNKNLTHLPYNVFSNLSVLQSVTLDECKISSLPRNFFEGSANLRALSLKVNKIEVIPENVFKNLTQLEDLNLSHNKIKNLPDDAFFFLVRLKILNMEGNLVTSIRKETFRSLKSLEKLNLKSNRISSIDMYSLRGAKNLKEIILANNCLDLPGSYVPGLSLFSHNEHLTKVDLSRNNITAVGDGFITKVHLEELDLSYNQITFVTFSEIFTASFPVRIDLRHNSILTVDFDEAETIAEDQDLSVYSSSTATRRLYLDGNPIECDCQIFKFVKYFDHTISPKISALVVIEADNLTCSRPADLEGFPVKLLKSNTLTCPLPPEVEDELNEKCEYSFRPWDESLIVNCTDANLTETPELILPKHNFFSHVEVDLRRNVLTSSPKKNMGYENVTKLLLSHNNVNEITWIPSNIKVLEIDNNNLNHLDSNVILQLNSSRANITLGKNPWNCECAATNFVAFLISHLEGKRIDITDIRCEKDGKLLVSLSAEDLCPTKTALILGTLGGLFLLAILIILIWWRYKQRINMWLWLYQPNMYLCCCCREDEIDEDRPYDAFISYSHRDEEFVLNDFLPVLEEGPRPYKICLHFRDWVAGEFISKQIAHSVANSRRTLIILSRNFLESEWAKMEFRAAIGEGRARLIVVLYGDVDVDSDLDEELRAYLRTRTYLRWDEPRFWDKLRYALSYSRNRW